MNDPQKSTVVHRALTGIMILHVMCSVALIGFSVYLHQLAVRLAEPQLTSQHQALITKLEAEQNLTVLRERAIAGWNLEASTWNRVVSAIANLDQGVMALCLLPVITAAIAVHALWSCRCAGRQMSSTQANDATDKNA